MAMGIQQQNHHHQGSPPMFPGDFVDYGGQYETNDRQPRNTANGTGNGRYRRPRSPSLDDDSRFTTGAPSEQTNSELHDAVLAQAAHQQRESTEPEGKARSALELVAGTGTVPPASRISYLILPPQTLFSYKEPALAPPNLPPPLLSLFTPKHGHTRLLVLPKKTSDEHTHTPTRTYTSITSHKHHKPQPPPPRSRTPRQRHTKPLTMSSTMQQRVVPTTQPAGARTQARAAGPRSGPPSMANASQNRRSYPQPPPVNSQLPPYAGNPEDEWSPASRAAAAAAGGSGAGAGGYSRRRTERHARRQSSTSGAPTASDPALQMSGGAASSSPRINNNGDHHPQRAPSNPAGLRPPSPPTAGMNLGLAGDEISRLQSPSISKSVLEPLQRKMLEYHNLMEEAQGQMTQLDAELRALQERRRQAEQRFVDAKGKHDEYERQHLDVEKALRGDYAMPIPQPQQQQQIHPQTSQQQHQMYNDSPPRTLGRPASSIMSYDERPMSGRSSMQGKKGKFRISLFGR